MTVNRISFGLLVAKRAFYHPDILSDDFLPLVIQMKPVTFAYCHSQKKRRIPSIGMLGPRWPWRTPWRCKLSIKTKQRISSSSLEMVSRSIITVTCWFVAGEYEMSPNASCREVNLPEKISTAVSSSICHFWWVDVTVESPAEPTFTDAEVMFQRTQ